VLRRAVRDTAQVAGGSHEVTTTRAQPACADR
jgi:hypothetical protein